MKTNPYVDIHCWKALSLRIVLRPLKIIFIRGPVRKLQIKNLSVFRTFPFESAGFFQSIEIGVQHTLKVLHFCK